MTTIKITKLIFISEVDEMLDWLNQLNSSYYEFTGDGIELITFKYASDAVAFKLRFNV